MPEEGLDQLVRLDRVSFGGHFLWVEINRDENLEEVTLEVTEHLRELIRHVLPPASDYFEKKDDPVDP